MRAAYQAESALVAEAQLAELAGELDKTHPGAAASLREGLEETLTVLAPGRAAHIGPHDALHQPPIESMISICREHSSNVKRWQGGQMAPCAGAPPA